MNRKTFLAKLTCGIAAACGIKLVAKNEFVHPEEIKFCQMHDIAEAAKLMDEQPIKKGDRFTIEGIDRVFINNL